MAKKKTMCQPVSKKSTATSKGVVTNTLPLSSPLSCRSPYSVLAWCNAMKKGDSIYFDRSFARTSSPLPLSFPLTSPVTFRLSLPPSLIPLSPSSPLSLSLALAPENGGPVVPQSFVHKSGGNKEEKKWQCCWFPQHVWALKELRKKHPPPLIPSNWLQMHPDRSAIDAFTQVMLIDQHHMHNATIPHVANVPHTHAHTQCPTRTSTQHTLCTLIYTTHAKEIRLKTYTHALLPPHRGENKQSKQQQPSLGSFLSICPHSLLPFWCPTSSATTATSWVCDCCWKWYRGKKGEEKMGSKDKWRRMKEERGRKVEEEV